MNYYGTLYCSDIIITCIIAVCTHLLYNSIRMKGVVCVAAKSKAITVRVDEATKEQAERMLDDMGINMTTYIASSLKALVREKRVPFKMVTSGYLTDQDIVAKLIESEKEAADPNTQWLTHDEVFAPLREKYGYEVQS